MSLDPQVQAIVDAYAAMPKVDLSAIPAAVFRAAMEQPSVYAPGDEVAQIENREIPGPGGALRIRIYRPKVAGRLPVTLYFHGGGFVICGLDTHENICRCLAQRAETLVVSVDYRLAPEAKFPAAVEDACAALKWLHAHAADIDGDASRIAVAGDSAGGNLATVTAQWAQQQGIELRHQLLFYPVTDCSCSSGSYREFAEGYVLSAEMMRWFIGHYLPDTQSADDPRASPLRQPDLGGLAPATIFTAACDPLRDEGEAYGSAMRKAGVEVNLQRWPGQIHGFISMLGAISAADQALTEAASLLATAFGGVASIPGNPTAASIHQSGRGTSEGLH